MTSDVLTPDEIAQVQRLFSDPLAFPLTFKQWITAWFEANPPSINIASLLGHDSFTPFFAAEPAESHFTITAFGDPNISGPAGPTLTGLPGGKYVVLWGGSGGPGASETIFMGVSANGATPIDAEAVEHQNVLHTSASRGAIFTLSLADGFNTLACQYHCTLAHDSDFRRRWIMALKYSNL